MSAQVLTEHCLIVYNLTFTLRDCGRRQRASRPCQHCCWPPCALEPHACSFSTASLASPGSQPLSGTSHQLPRQRATRSQTTRLEHGAAGFRSGEPKRKPHGAACSHGVSSAAIDRAPSRCGCQPIGLRPCALSSRSCAQEFFRQLESERDSLALLPDEEDGTCALQPAAQEQGAGGDAICWATEASLLVLHNGGRSSALTTAATAAADGAWDSLCAHFAPEAAAMPLMPQAQQPQTALFPQGFVAPSRPASRSCGDMPSPQSMSGASANSFVASGSSNTTQVPQQLLHAPPFVEHQVWTGCAAASQQARAGRSLHAWAGGHNVNPCGWSKLLHCTAVLVAASKPAQTCCAAQHMTHLPGMNPASGATAPQLSDMQQQLQGSRPAATTGAAMSEAPLKQQRAGGGARMAPAAVTATALLLPPQPSLPPLQQQQAMRTHRSSMAGGGCAAAVPTPLPEAARQLPPHSAQPGEVVLGCLEWILTSKWCSTTLIPNSRLKDWCELCVLPLRWP